MTATQKSDLLIHMVLGASDYLQIKVQEIPRIGSPGEPVAKLTQLGYDVSRERDRFKQSNVI